MIQYNSTSCSLSMTSGSRRAVENGSAATPAAAIARGVRSPGADAPGQAPACGPRSPRTTVTASSRTSPATAKSCSRRRSPFSDASRQIVDGSGAVAKARTRRCLWTIHFAQTELTPDVSKRYTAVELQTWCKPLRAHLCGVLSKTMQCLTAAPTADVILCNALPTWGVRLIPLPTCFPLRSSRGRASGVSPSCGKHLFKTRV